MFFLLQSSISKYLETFAITPTQKFAYASEKIKPRVEDMKLIWTNYMYQKEDNFIRIKRQTVDFFHKFDVGLNFLKCTILKIALNVLVNKSHGTVCAAIM